jgi:hypothetical protein
MITSRLFSSLAIICLIVFSLHSRALVAGEGDKSSLIKSIFEGLDNLGKTLDKFDNLKKY